MPTTIFEVEFDREGKPVDSTQEDKALAYIDDHKAKDVIVISHGWNNDIADASDLYRKFFQSFDAVRMQAGAPATFKRDFVAIEVFWPSKRFTDAELIAGGAASLEADDAVIHKLLDELEVEPQRLGKNVSSGHEAAVAKAKALVPRLENDAAAQREFVELIRGMLPKTKEVDDGSHAFCDRDPIELLTGLAAGVDSPALAAGEGGAAGLDGGGASLADVWTGMKDAARRLLNFTTYYRMKERAGLVGSTGVAAMIRKLRAPQRDCRVHLVGHSFGGRLVTAAADAMKDGMTVQSMSLLQAAYSHNGLGEKYDEKKERDGFFRKIVTGKKVEGPIIITFTKNDRAVGIAYPLASRVAGQNAAAFGDADDPYGGMGRNGAQHSKATFQTLLPITSPHQFAKGKVHNLNADAFITEHNDICGKEVASAVLWAANP